GRFALEAASLTPFRALRSTRATSEANPTAHRGRFALPREHRDARFSRSASPTGDDPTFAFFDEREEMLEVRALAERMRVHLLEGLRAVVARAIKDPKCLLHRFEPVGREP